MTISSEQTEVSTGRVMKLLERDMTDLSYRSWHPENSTSQQVA